MAPAHSKPSRKKWDPDAMMKAVEAVRKKEMGYLKASKIFRVPRSTLENYVNHKSKDAETLCHTKLGRRPVLPETMENDLVDYCLMMEEKFYGLRSSDIRRLAWQLALRNNLKHPFSEDSGKAGKKWLKNFLRRHPTITFRKPQAISISRVKGFCKENVNDFFNILEEALKTVKFSPCKVFNVDETGLTIVQHKCSKVVSLRGKKQVCSLSSAERGALMTLVVCMSAAGQFVPPMIVFPRKNMKAELLEGAPPGTIAACHPSGWIQQDLFTQWLMHFVHIVKPSTEDPVVLVLDGHYSHTRNMDVIDIGRRHGIHIVCLPPHSTHRLQPLDVAFMSPLKTYYAQEVESPMPSSHCLPGGKINGESFLKGSNR